MNATVEGLLSWVVGNTASAGAVALVLVTCARWVRTRPAIGNFGWLVVIALVVMPPVPGAWSPGVREQAERWVRATGDRPPRGAPRLNQREGKASPRPELEAVAEPAWGGRGGSEATGRAATPSVARADGDAGWEAEAAVTNDPEALPPVVRDAGATRGALVEGSRADDGEPVAVAGRSAWAASAESAQASPRERAPDEAGGEIARWPGASVRSATRVLVAVWVAGLAVCAWRQVRALGSLRGIQRRGEQDAGVQARVNALARVLGVRPPRAVVSSRVQSPMVWCVGERVLVWPASVAHDAPGADGMIAHELAHLRRGDHWSAWLELAALTLFWWHPLVWLAHRRARGYAELACDAWVAWALPEERRSYAEALLAAATRRASRGGAALAFGVMEHSRADFARRLTMVMTGSGSKRLPPAVAALGLGVLVALTPRMAAGLDGPEVAGLAPEVSQRLDEGVRRAVERAVAERMADRAEDASEYDEGERWLRRAIELGGEGLQEDLALLCYEAGRYAEGVDPFVAAYEESRDEDALYNAACCAALAGQTDRALDLLDRSVRAGYGDADHMREDEDLSSVRGGTRFEEIARRAGRLEALDDEIDEVTDAAGDRGDAGLWARAAELYGERVDLAGEDRSGLSMAAYCSILGGRLDDAERWLRRQLDEGHEVGTACYNMACVSSLRGRAGEAVRWLNRAADEGFDQHGLMREDPDLDAARGEPGFADALARVSRGDRLWREMRLEADFGAWDGVIERALALRALGRAGEGWSSEAALALARAYTAQGRHGDALGAATEAARAGHDLGEALMIMAESMQAQGRSEDAAAHYAAAIDAGFIDEDEFAGSRGHAHEGLRELEAHPGVVEARRRARAFEELAQFDAISWEQLERRARAEIDEDPDDSDGYLMLGWALLRQGRHEGALDAFEALGRHGSEGLAAYNVACVHAQAGRIDAAFEAMRRARDAGFGDRDQYASDPDFKPMHGDGRWGAFIDGFGAAGEGHEHEEWEDDGF